MIDELLELINDEELVEVFAKLEPLPIYKTEES